MNVIELSRGIASLAATKPEFEVAIRAAISRVVGESVIKRACLSELRALAESGHSALLAWYVSQLDAGGASKLVKRIDPNVDKKVMENKATASTHLIELIEGRQLPAEKVGRAKTQKEPPMPFDAIIRLADGNARRAELKKHKPADIKQGIKKNGVD